MDNKEAAEMTGPRENAGDRELGGAWGCFWPPYARGRGAHADPLLPLELGAREVDSEDCPFIPTCPSLQKGNPLPAPKVSDSSKALLIQSYQNAIEKIQKPARTCELTNQNLLP